MKIALEEAFAVKGVETYTPQILKLREFRQNEAKLHDLADMRLRAMDEGEVEIAVLSATSPSIQGITDPNTEIDTARAWNDYVAKAIAPNMNRLRAFACLPMRYPDAAIDELRRAVCDLGLVGAMINGYDNAGGLEPLYYDAPQYLDFWKAAEALDVPVYIHPRTVPDDRETSYKPYPELKGSAWGFHIETAEHVLRLIVSGLLDKVPDIKIFLGHMGEILPFWCWRLDHRIQMEGWDGDTAAENGRPRKLTITEYLQRNTYITTSGVFNTPALDHALKVMGSDRIMYSVDYPYEDYTEANEWFKTLDYAPDVLQAIAYDNAKRVLKL
jgi:2,3-dihydroxybenzoate decarboxylase